MLAFFAKLDKKLDKKLEANPSFAILFIFVIFAIGCLAISYFYSQSLLGVFIEFSYMFFLAPGLILLVIGMIARKGVSKHCAACEYQCPPSGSCPTRCPECGVDWRGVGAVVKGKRIGNRGYTLAGVIFLVIFLLDVISVFVTMDWKIDLLPTDSLIAQVTSEKRYTLYEWRVLRSRTLSREQVVTLAESQLDIRKRDDRLDMNADDWIVAQIMVGSLPADLVERYYLEYLDLELKGRGWERSGTTIQIDLRSICRDAFTLNNKPFVYIGDYRINGTPVPGSKAEHVIAGDAMDKEDFALEMEIPSVEVVHVQLDLWLVFAPFNSLNGPIVWQDDGTPVIPSSVTWSRKLTLEHVIEIVE